MLTTQIPFTIPADPLGMEVWLRTAGESDLLRLREWKNSHREFFFFKEEISSEQQKEWYHAYQLRQEDYMFIVTAGEIPIGCMGIRLVDDKWDVYNVILGLPDQAGKGLMSKALRMMLSFAASHKTKPITVKVLKKNPAVRWYKKNGFVETEELQDHFCMWYQTQ